MEIRTAFAGESPGGGCFTATGMLSLGGIVMMAGLVVWVEVSGSV
jgi:hypothetical protein